MPAPGEINEIGIFKLYLFIEVERERQRVINRINRIWDMEKRKGVSGNELPTQLSGSHVHFHEKKPC